MIVLRFPKGILNAEWTTVHQVFVEPHQQTSTVHLFWPLKTRFSVCKERVLGSLRDGAAYFHQLDLAFESAACQSCPTASVALQ